MHIKLKPLPEKFFNRFLNLVINDYTRTLYTNKTFDLLSEAHAHVNTHISFLLPDGLNSKNHYILEITSITKDILKRTIPHHIGYLWIEISTTATDQKSAWINFIYIEPQERNKGYATAALKVLETRLLAQTIGSVGLTVFGTNQPARNLYISLGYSDTASQKSSDDCVIYWHMAKKLSN